jgi:uncharacterized protein YuzE
MFNITTNYDEEARVLYVKRLYASPIDLSIHREGLTLNMDAQRNVVGLQILDADQLAMSWLDSPGHRLLIPHDILIEVGLWIFENGGIMVDPGLVGNSKMWDAPSSRTPFFSKLPLHRDL